ncbi:hypothetical protein CONPUDRAFT_160315 [Coniophora puteana RWD-64-598 SS2]|uniref:DUF6533 domain-containing protein n=1 Tax=Coniophora puteana (strain RWD-64-598) TaxID=741705 RepID=R7SDN1_CONPW|nr:uncharacterized protein CONPUDRAFT_160315 [Coniophora puteana RWD-64-598 SS2]EIW74273.1 hypothetical protein CONPUDRAFT_160315 [Coniophora puteana RWD-64-598 SS2]
MLRANARASLAFNPPDIMNTDTLQEELMEAARSQVLTNYARAAAVSLMAYDYFLNLGLEISMIWELKRFEPAMLAIRAYVIIGRPNKISWLLVSSFVAAQAVSFASNIVIWANGPSMSYVANNYGIRYCVTDTPASVNWVPSAANGALAAFEVIISVLVAFHAVKSYPANYKFSTNSGKTLMSIVVRDNLVYFVIAFLALVINTMANAPSLNQSIAYWDIESIFEFIFLTMVGPWMILNTRKHIRHDSVDGTDGTELTDVIFSSVPPMVPAEYPHDNDYQSPAEAPLLRSPA